MLQVQSKYGVAAKICTVPNYCTFYHTSTMLLLSHPLHAV